MSDTKNFLISLAALRDSTKYVLDYLNSQDFSNVDTNNGQSPDNNNELNCSEAFDVLKSLKKDVKTFTNTNFTAAEGASGDSSSEEFRDCETANFENLRCQLNMIVDNFDSDIDVLNSNENSTSDSKEPKLDIVLSHQETLKSIENPNEPIPKIEIPISNNKSDDIKKENNNTEKSEAPDNKNNQNNLQTIITNFDDSNNHTDEINKSDVVKNFLFNNTMPQTPEIEKIKNTVTDVDLNKLNNIEIIKLILESLIQNCNELLQLKSDTLSAVLGAYPKSPLMENSVISTSHPQLTKNNKNEDINDNSNDNQKSSEEEKSKAVEEDKQETSPKEDSNEASDSSNKSEKDNNNMKVDENNDNNIEKLNNDLDEIESLGTNKPRNPKELIKELECFIILIHSLYENVPKKNENTSPTTEEKYKERKYSSADRNTRSDSMSSVLTSNTELNSVINAIDSLLKSSPRFNNQCVQINSESRKKFQLMGVLSVVDRMTRTRLNDQRATPNQLNRVNKLIELLNKSLVRQYVEQRFAISPDKENNGTR